MELRCPECCSPEVIADPPRSAEALRCANCGARFQPDAALVNVLEAKALAREAAPEPLFTFQPKLAASELRRRDGAIWPITPYSDPDELHRLIEGAQAKQLVGSGRPRAAIYVYPLSVGEPDPLLAVDPGIGPTLLGFDLKLRQGEDEDPISFTVRFLEEAVEEANGLAARLGADSASLDRIAAFMNECRPWSRDDVCALVERELHESGRAILGE